MKIAGADAVDEALAVESPDALGQHVDAALLFLKLPFDHERIARANFATVAFVDVRAHDDVHQSRFVLEREKYEAFGSARTLARDDQAADAAHEVRRHLRELTRGEDSRRFELRAEMFDRLALRRDAGRP